MDEATPQRDIILGRVGLVVAFLIIWEVVGQSSPFLLSAPSLVVTTFLTMVSSGEIFRLLLASGRIFLISWGIAVVGGVALGLAVGWIRPVRLMLEPFLNALYSTPLVALIPLMVLWFGLGLNAMVVSVVLNGIFPIIIMSIIGVSNAGKDYLEVARSFRLGQVATLTKVVLPGALPYLLVGLRLTTSSVLRGTIFAGFLIPDNGIGNALRAAGEAFNTNRLYALIIFVVAAAILVDVALRRGISLVDYTRN
jgi:ABC-type nitrate/sulfonate/bicarbonate transport system permease component